MNDFPRLIEFAFPLKQTSLDSVHEKNVRHGHISTLHIWPARRPLAACRAALIATLLPDPGDAEKRNELCEKIAGTVVKKIERKKMPNGQTVERIKEETEGGILHWGRETENAESLEWFRQEIRKAYGGRAPRVLDPFAGGGAIPLEAMRLGCEVTAVDINPVAWFILKCTLEYPQKLAGQSRPLPEFILQDDAFMVDFFKKSKCYSKAETTAAMKRLHQRLDKNVSSKSKDRQSSIPFPQAGDWAAEDLLAGLPFQVRAWGQWVVDRARRKLAQYYPTYADFQPMKLVDVAYEHQPMRLVPLREDGTADIESLNADFTQEFLEDKRNPRWVAKTAVAYLWARTVTCKNCRVSIPLLKTLWLCRGPKKRIRLSIVPDSELTRVDITVLKNVPTVGGNAAQRREHDKRIGKGTMSRAGATCPCCNAIMTSTDIQVESQADRRGEVLTAVVVEGLNGKEYRSPTSLESTQLSSCKNTLTEVFAQVPFGVPSEPIPEGASRVGGGSPFTVYKYGMRQWSSLFNSRQLLCLGEFVLATRALFLAIGKSSMQESWANAVLGAAMCLISKIADKNSTLVEWQPHRECVGHTFKRFALPITWDYVELNPLSTSTGNAMDTVKWISDIYRVFEYDPKSPSADVRCGDAQDEQGCGAWDAVVTDPPYYDAIPYASIMDFFYVWLRRCCWGLSDAFDAVFCADLSPKWDSTRERGELVDDASRFQGKKDKSKEVYEKGMATSFQAAYRDLRDEGRLVVVFAHKEPDAWETLVSAIIRAGFVVDGSWPIQTEMVARSRAISSAALSSSVWLVCKKRPLTARAGWDTSILEEMRANVAGKLREFWDAGIRGPDFVWAATGPAMEAYSKHPVVRKANAPGEVMGVGEFLNHVRRMVVDYIVGQVLSGEQGADMAAADRLDEVSAYYLLHRHDFGLDDAPVGACILYATACGLSDAELEKTWDILVHAGSDAAYSEDGADESEEAADSDESEEPAEAIGGGSKVKLKPWNQRRHKSMGHEAPEGKAVPLVDRIHRMMHLWKDGDVQKVNEYLDQHALRRNELFKRVVQSLIELSTDTERSLLESISNHIGARGVIRDRGPSLPFGEDE